MIGSRSGRPVWIACVVFGVFTAIVVGMLPYQPYTADEFYYPDQLVLGRILFSHHLLTTLNVWFVWGTTSLFGIEFSPWQITRFTNFIYSAIAAGAGFAYIRTITKDRAATVFGCALLVFANGFWRYGTSTYPHVGFIAFLFLALLVARKTGSAFWTGVVSGIGAMVHGLFVLFLPLVAYVTVRRVSPNRADVAKIFFRGAVGFTVTIAPFAMAWLYFKIYAPGHLELPRMGVSGGSFLFTSEEIFSFSGVFKHLKTAALTLMGLYFPGPAGGTFISRNLLRFFGFAVMGFLFVRGIRRGACGIRGYVVQFTFVFIFLALNFSDCRQYVLFLHPLLVLILALGAEGLPKARLLGASTILFTAIGYYGAFGLEGLQDFTSHDRSALERVEKKFRDYDALFTPSRVRWDYLAHPRLYSKPDYIDGDSQ